MTTGMTKTAVPKVGVDGDIGLRKSQERTAMEGVVRARAIGSENFGPGWIFLHRETKGIKFNRYRVVSAKLSNRNKIFNYMRSNQNIAEV